ncbi:MAG: PulJ/GspJ family protein [Coraliomargarita sp.]
MNHLGFRTTAFTLIEVVITLAIFASAAVVLSQAFTNALLAREHGISNDNYEADIRTVRMQLLLEPDLENAEDGGDIETYKNGEASWQANIEPTNVVDLFRVELQIQFSEPEEGQDNSYTETLYLLRPTWSEADERSELLADKKDELESSRDFR